MKPITQISNAAKKGIRFVLTDIDDTLTHNGRLPALAYESMERLKQADIKVIPITGRPAGWCDHFASHDIQLDWGPGRHGPGNNLFVFITDPDGNWIEVSAELEVIYDRGVVDWPQHPRTLNKWGRAIMRS